MCSRMAIHFKDPDFFPNIIAANIWSPRSNHNPFSSFCLLCIVCLLNVRETSISANNTDNRKCFIYSDSW